MTSAYNDLVRLELDQSSKDPSAATHDDERAIKFHDDGRDIPTHDDGRTSYRLDGKREEYLPIKCDALGDQKVDRHGNLKGGRQYACSTHHFPPPYLTSRPFLRAVECARTLGYKDIETMVRDNSTLVVVHVLNNERVYRGKRGSDAYILALTVFRRFGYHIIRRGRAVFDDYFEVDAKAQGLRDRTLWAAARGVLSLHDVDTVLRQCHAADFLKQDSCCRTPLGYMKDLLLKGETFEMLWSHALRAKGVTTQAAQDALCKLIHGIMLAIPDSLVGSEAELSEFNTSTVGTDNVLQSETLPTAVVTDLDQQETGSALRGYIDLLPHVFRALEKAKCVSESTEQKQCRSTDTWLFQWEVPEVIKALVEPEYPIEQALGDFITVSGSSRAYECAAVFQMLRKFWPASSSQLVIDISCRVLRELLQKPHAKAVSGSLELVDGLTCHYVATFSTLILDGTIFRSPEVESAISWLCAAVRTVPKRSGGDSGRDDLPYQSVRWSSDMDHKNGRVLFAGLWPLKDRLQVPSDSSCWLSLFQPIPVVEMTIPRTKGIGLEIPFDLMVTLACIENAWAMNGGTVLLGFFTALIPKQVWETGIQWHFEEVRRIEGREKQLLSLEELRKQTTYTVDPVDQDQLLGKTCYVGWFSNANIMLGTRDLVESDWLFSEAEGLDVHTKTLESSGYEAGVQSAFPSLPIVFKAAKAWKYSKHVAKREPIQCYRDALVCREGYVCLAIDTQAKRAWFVPLLSLLLHLCHRYYRHASESGADVPKEYPIPFADPSPDGAAAVIKVMSDAADKVVLGSTDSTGAFRLSQLFHRLLNTIGDHPQEATGSFVVANDLMDVVTHGSRTQPRKVPVNKGRFWWPDLVPFAEKAHAVGVCANLGQAIEPDITMGGRICTCSGLADTSCCYTLPEQHGYLAAHVSSISVVCKMHDLRSEGECMISQAYWSVQHNPWEVASRCNGVSIWADELAAKRTIQTTSSYPLMDRLSKVKGKKRAEPPLDEAEMKIDAPENGVVVFGRWREKESNVRSGLLEKFKAHAAKRQVKA